MDSERRKKKRERCDKGGKWKKKRETFLAEWFGDFCASGFEGSPFKIFVLRGFSENSGTLLPCIPDHFCGLGSGDLCKKIVPAFRWFSLLVCVRIAPTQIIFADRLVVTLLVTMGTLF